MKKIIFSGCFHMYSRIMYATAFKNLNSKIVTSQNWMEHSGGVTCIFMRNVLAS